MIVPNWRTDEAHGEMDALANECGTDKGSRPPMGHGYTRWYEPLLEGRRTEPLRLLEIGIGHAASSLKLWAEWLPNAEITGADIRPDVIEKAQGRWKAVLCDCGSLTDLAAKFSGQQFDIIIDDGSHREADVFTALNFFWPLLAPAGWYAIEDLSCQADDYFLDLEAPRSLVGRNDFPARLEQALVLLHARRLQIFPSQLRWPQGTGGQCLAVLHK